MDENSKKEIFRSTFEQAAVGIIYASQDGKFVRVNRRFCEITGYEEEELLSMTFSQITHVEDRAKDLAYVYRMLKGEIDTFSMEKRYIKKGGKITWVNLTVSLVKESPDAQIYFLGVVEDINIRKEAERSLRENEVLFKLFTGNISDVIWFMDRDFKLTYVSPSITKFRGYTVEEALSHSLFESVTESSQATVKRFVELYLPLANDGRIEEIPEINVEIEQPHKAGHTVWADVTISPLFDEKKHFSGILGISRDITDKKAAEKHKYIDELLYKALVHVNEIQDRDIQDILDYALDTGVKLTESTIGYIYFYSEITEKFTLFAWSKDVMPSCRIVNPKTEYELKKTGLWGEAIRQRKAIITNNYAAPNAYKKGTPEGHVPLIRHMNVPVFHETNIVALIGVGNKNSEYTERDIHSLSILMDGVWRIKIRKDMKNALRESEQKYRAICDSSAEGIIIIDTQTLCPYYCNAALVDMFGYTFEEIREMSIFSLYSPQIIADIKAKLSKAVSSGSGYFKDIACLKKEGTLFFADIRTTTVKIDDRIFLLGLFADTTERKKAEEKIQEVNEELEKRVNERTADLLEALDRLTVSEKRYRLLFETMAQGVVYQDSQGLVINANPAAEKILGVTIDQMQGRTSMDPRWKCIHEDGSDFPGNEHPAMIALATGKIIKNVLMGIFNPVENRHKWTRVTAVPQFHKDEVHPYQVYAIIDDITDMRKAEVEKNQYFELSQDMICITDFEGHFQFINNAFEKILGYPKEVFTNNPFIDFVYPEDRSMSRMAMSVLSRGQALTDFENRYEDSRGQLHWLSWRATPDMNSRLIYAVARDVTDRKIFEEALKRAKDEAERANRAKSEFLANMSHEIRTPLNAVTGFSELLASVVKDEKQISFIKSIKAAGNSLLTLINDILDLSKIEAGMMQIQQYPVSLKELFFEVYQIFRLKAREKGLKLSYNLDETIPYYIMLDETRARQILVNLVGNAIKFTDKGSVTLHASFIPGTENKLIMSVKDTGIGIPEEEQERVFDSFVQQTGQSIRKFGGTGLGLSISKKLVNLMDGRLFVESKPGEGSRFFIEFRDIKVPEGDVVPLSKKALFEYQNIHFEKCTVLVVDDSVSNRVLIKELLVPGGVNVLEAENGEEAIILAEARLPDLILMDIRMPEMDGRTATIHLRNNEATRNLPIIAMTASVSVQDIGSERGFDGYLTKPVNIPELFEILQKFLKTLDYNASPSPGVFQEQEYDINSITRPGELKDDLQLNLIPRYSHFLKTIIIGDIKGWIKEFRSYGEKYGAGYFNLLASRLELFEENFDIAGIKNILDLIKDFFMKLSKGVDHDE